MSFDLQKWYMDCVAPDGTLFIGYAARLRWKALELGFVSHLILRDGTLQTESCLTGFTAPIPDGSKIEWRNEQHKLVGQWVGFQSGAPRTLLDTAAGRVTWHCWAPNADAEVAFDSGWKVRGRGYVEYLHLTLAPWNLPIEQLQWGRFLSDEHALTWIRWSGQHPVELAILNGKDQDALQVGPDGVKVATAALSFESRHVIREGTIAQSLLGVLGGASSLFPDSILNLHESKSLSRASLRLNDGQMSSGWAIHEVVRWP